MRLGFLFGFVVVMWALIIIGGFILIKVVAPIQLESGDITSSVLKAVIAISMVIIWIWILVTLKNTYTKRRLTKIN
ncbi:MAG TPA: hypothetical protein VI698_01155 [Nitrososphaerales archaeon]|nr:hypothetical protein [Nitrososphaerales archaeon]